MSTILGQAQEAVHINEQPYMNGHDFFDPRMPNPPEQVLGIDTEAILRLGSATLALGALPPAVNLNLYALPHIVRLLPLVEQMQSGEVLTPEDVRPYRKPIKGLSLGLNTADKLTATASVIGVGIPLRRALNHKIEQEFPVRAHEAAIKAGEGLAAIKEEVEYIASFNNPREQFVNELNYLSQTVTHATREEANRRIYPNPQSAHAPETQKGIAGFFKNIFRKVKSFFGMHGSKKEESREITAYDAGAGIHKTLTSLIANPEQTKMRLPLLSKFVFNRLASLPTLTADRLALVAPELLNFFFSAVPKDVQTDNLLKSVERNPHKLRFITMFKKHYGRYSLEGVQRASRTLLPAVRDILPTSGDRVRHIYEQAEELFRHSYPQQEYIVSGDEGSEKNTKHNGLKNLFRKFKTRFSKA